MKLVTCCGWTPENVLKVGYVVDYPKIYRKRTKNYNKCTKNDCKRSKSE